MDSPDQSTYELVVLGATGYTGKLVAEHITTSLPSDLKWAVAGRNAQKLNTLTQELKKLNKDRIQPDILTAALNKNELESLAKKTRLVLNCIGPYHLYSTPVVEACVNTGTHYMDISGEPPWYKEVIDKFHERAKANKAIIIPQIGFDSTPADMLSWILVNYIRRTLSAPTREVIFSAEQVKMAASGGTLATAISLFNHYSRQDIQAVLNPFSLSPVPRQELHDTRSLVTKYLGVRHEPELGILTSSPLAPGDTVLVHRSWGLLDDGLLYGKRFFFYSHLRSRTFVLAALWHVGLMMMLLALALFPPARWLAQKTATKAGEGPDTTETRSSRTFIRAIGTADTTASKKRAMATLDYKSGPYYLTAVSIAEGAMVLLRGAPTEATRQGGGILTPATLGGQFVDRLNKAGVDMDVNLI